jgi:hypothetical protein
MAGYTKLHSSILTSTVWCEDMPTRIVWITMLALAEADGLVDATVPGLANLARVPIEDVRRAIELFLSPDPDSRDQAFGGRRIERVGGVFRLLNYEKYRYKDSPDHKREVEAARQRRHRERKREMSRDKRDCHAVTPTGRDMSRDSNVTSRQAEAEAEAEADIIDPCSSNEDLPSHAPPNGSLAAAAACEVKTNPSATPTALPPALESGVGISEAPTASSPAPEPEDSSPARAITDGLPSPAEVQARTWPLTERFAQHLAELRGLTACPLSRPKRENRDRFEWLLSQIGVAEAAKAAWADWQEAVSRGEKVTSLGFFLRLLELRAASPPRTKSKPLSNCEPWADILEQYRANGNRDTAEYLAKWVSPRVEEQILMLEVSDQAFADYVERYLPDIESEALEHHGLTVRLRLNRQSADEAAAGGSL